MGEAVTGSGFQERTVWPPFDHVLCSVSFPVQVPAHHHQAPRICWRRCWQPAERPQPHVSGACRRRQVPW